MLIAEILLTIWAWRRGWTWLALIPVGIAFGIGLLLGSMIANGANIDLAAAVWLDVIAIVALIIMIARPKKEEHCDKIEEIKESKSE